MPAQPPLPPLARPGASRHRERRAQQWLQAPGSLTARLRGLGAVSVSRVRQGHGRLLPHERRVMGASHGHIREVVLWVDGIPAVWARSVASVTGIQGAWRAVRGLGNRPLAELLFADRAVRRAALQAAPLLHQGPGASHRLRTWPTPQAASRAAEAAHTAPPTWMRWSLFARKGQPLLVQEAFAPWVLARTLPDARPTVAVGR